MRGGIDRLLYWAVLRHKLDLYAMLLTDIHSGAHHTLDHLGDEGGIRRGELAHVDFAGEVRQDVNDDFHGELVPQQIAWGIEDRPFAPAQRSADHSVAFHSSRRFLISACLDSPPCSWRGTSTP